ncbi:MAG: CRTAC1 family protein [Planctomycetota bacterium]|jgi:hypothetical protein
MKANIPLAALLLVSALVCGCSDSDAPPTVAPPVKPKEGLGFAYVDVARASGYSLRNRTGKDGAKEYILEAMPPGIAVGDFNGDGYYDLYCPNGNDITRYDPKSQRIWLIPPDDAPRNELFFNIKGERFEAVGKASGVDDPGWGYGAVAGDVDNDGDTDLYLCNWGVNRLFLNDGTGKFKDVGTDAGVAGDPRHWSAGACLVDYDRDGDLDLYVAQYADVYDMLRREDITTILPDGTITGRNCEWKHLQVYCGPLGLTPENDVLFKNQLMETGKLTFSNVTRAAGVWLEMARNSRTSSSAGPFYGFQPIAWDIDGDGWQDIFVANDSVENLAWINQKDGTFKNRAPAMNLAISMDDQNPQASMGVAVGDINGDGMFDLVVTEFSHDQFNLLLGERYQSGLFGFEEMAAKTDLRRITFDKLGWGAVLLDPDLDGDLDIFFACGHVYPEVDNMPNQDTNYRQNNVFVLNEDAGRLRLRDVGRDGGPGLQVKKCSRAAVAIDFDNDGDPDIATTEMNDTPSLLRCDRPADGRHWIAVRLVGDPSQKVPTDPAGAVVTVRAGGRALKRALHIGSSFQCSEDPRLLFGLGKAATVDIEVLWPNGMTTKQSGVKADQLVTLTLSPR